MRSTRTIDRYAYAHDASHFLLIPEAVDVADDIYSISQLLRTAQRPLVFRSGGTSLSGQASTDGLLVDTRKNFRKITVLDDGARVRVQPGATVREVNIRLTRYGYKLGPDPASEVACTIGGVIANNSSGMLCGTEFNTYKTLESLTIIFPSGSILDTSRFDADDELRLSEPLIYQGIIRLRNRIRGNHGSVSVIKKYFSMKNTMGYAINAFIDFEKPVDILTHLLVGSEGTLAFIADATFRTVPIKPHIATSFLVFDTLHAATSALPDLVATDIAAIELLDATSLRVSQRDPKATDLLRNLKVDGHAGLLVEYQELSELELRAKTDSAREVISKFKLSTSADFSSEKRIRGDLWHIRKGLYATVAGARRSGTTALLEDIAVPVPTLAQTCESLTQLFDKFDYEDAVIFGHAKDGNIHFMLNEDFTSDVKRYSMFTEAMVDLVLSHEGTLKAEHGTGRVMAPYVRRQYGDELYEVMCEIKRLLDPRNVLNPGSIISEDAQIHIKNLKIVPTVEEEVDRCVECGYCEPVCPSKNLTLTPRQRIVVRREMQRAKSNGDEKLYASLKADYGYESLDTCAVDGMCGTACPVLINTGDLVKRLRADQMPAIQKVGWTAAASTWNLATRAISTGLSVAASIPGFRFPFYSKDLPRGGDVREPVMSKMPVATYFPSCTSTIFTSNLRDAFLQLCAKAGVEIATPDGIGDLCCGQPWKSKGASRGYAAMKTKTQTWITQHGLPVICDAASCTESLKTFSNTIDIVDFFAEDILPKLSLKKLNSLAVHPTCASTQGESNDSLLKIAHAIAEEVFIPDSWGCCAFAGDRGLLRPELTRSATTDMAEEINQRSFDAYVSNNRTCEIGMSRATGKQYRHIIELVFELAQ